MNEENLHTELTAVVDEVRVDGGVVVCVEESGVTGKHEEGEAPLVTNNAVLIARGAPLVSVECLGAKLHNPI